MHYQILKVGAELNQRFLAITKLGNLWTNAFGSTRFTSQNEAEQVASRLENVRIIWLDPSHPAKWGELNS